MLSSRSAEEGSGWGFGLEKPSSKPHKTILAVWNCSDYRDRKESPCCLLYFRHLEMAAPGIRVVFGGSVALVDLVGMIADRSFLAECI